MVSATLRRASWRHFVRHPWQLALGVVGVALSVAIIVAVDLANESARRAFERSTTAALGRTTHRIVGGPAGLDEQLYTRLRIELGVRGLAPLIEGHGTVGRNRPATLLPRMPPMNRTVSPSPPSPLPPSPSFPLPRSREREASRSALRAHPFTLGEGGEPLRPSAAGSSVETLRVYGIDPFAESGVRDHLQGIDRSVVQRLLTERNAVLLADVTATRLGLTSGATLHLRVGSRTHAATLIGIIATDDTTRAALDGMCVTDIATAQVLFDRVGHLDSIDLVLPEGPAGDAVRARIVHVLPPDAELLPAEARGRTLAQMTNAFGTNLTAMSLIALLVGTFLIYNTMSFAVVQRRTLLGQLRALGVTRGEIYALVLIEGAIVGVIGVGLGLVTGIALGQGLVRLVTRTINDLYFVVTVTELHIAPLLLLKAAAVGLAGTLAAVLIPAYEAAMSTPRAALARSMIEMRARAVAPRLAVGGLIAALVAIVILWVPSTNLVVAFGGMFLLLSGLIAMIPFAVRAFTAIPRPRSGPRLPLTARLALAGIGAALSRTGVAIAALTLAVATTIGVGVMVASFRHSVEAWLDTTLRADVYIGTPRLASSRTAPGLDPSFIARARRLPGLDYVSSARRVTVESRHGLDTLVALDVPRAYAPRFALLEGRGDASVNAFFDGRAVLVSEPYSYHHDIHPGATIELRTDRGWKPLAVAGVYRDYSSDQGEIAMIRGLYDAHYADPAVSTLGLWLAPGSDPGTVIDAVRAQVPADQELLVRSNAEIRAASLEIFDRTFTITDVLRLLTVGVAFVGVLSALMALALERAREIGVLRALGFTPGQIGAFVTLQTGFMGLAAGVLAIPMGLALALLLTHVINRRSFGWSMDTVLPPHVFGEALLLAIGAALLAALYPAWRMARARPAEILREE